MTRIRTSVPPRWAVPVGFVAGGAAGALARGWMRWISVTPEFSWAGTIGIVMGFALFGTVQSAAWAARRAEWSRARVTVVRLVAVPLSLGLFMAAGALMFPTVAAASLALWRSNWWRAVRTLLALAALPGVLYVSKTIVDDFGWNPVTAGRILLFLAIYAAIILCTRPTVAPYSRDELTLAGAALAVQRAS